MCIILACKYDNSALILTSVIVLQVVELKQTAL